MGGTEVIRVQLCRVGNDGYLCTLNRGHLGDHVAHDHVDVPLRRWPSASLIIRYKRIGSRTWVRQDGSRFDNFQLSLTTDRSHFNFGVEPWDAAPANIPDADGHVVLRPRIGTIRNQSANRTMQRIRRSIGPGRPNAELWSATLRRAWVEGCACPRPEGFRGSPLWFIWCRLLNAGAARAQCIREVEAQR